MTQARLGARVMLAIPTLSSNPRSPAWIDAMAGLQMPLGSSLGRIWIEDETIAAARNALCERALASDAQYICMLGDDVLPSPNMLISMLATIGRELPVEDGTLARASMVTGVYWTKAYPTEPYLWNGLLQGSYTDWKVGELFPIDLAGCDALMIETAMLREIPQPWFSTDWVYEPGQQPSAIATEDFYFFTKARKHGFRLFVDTAIQCWHQDRETGQMFGLTVDMPQAGGVPEGADAQLLVADLGSGTDSPTWGPNCQVTRFDANPSVKPDIRCDIRKLPEGYFGTYDIVHARHVLEHFGRAEAPDLVRHWAKLLKPGGELILRVPNLEYAMRQILDGEPSLYAWHQLYGEQRNALDYHKNGFTARKLTGLISSLGIFSDVSVVEEGDGLHLKLSARLIAADVPDAIAPWWDAIKEQEHAITEEPPAPEPEPDEPDAVTPMVTQAFTTRDAVDRLNGREAAAVEAT